MQKAWKVPILFMGLSLPEHGYHAPNEYFRLGPSLRRHESLRALFWGVGEDGEGDRAA